MVAEGCVISERKVSAEIPVNRRASSTGFNSFQAATRYYNTLSLSGTFGYEPETSDCLALRLCRVLLSEIRSTCPRKGGDSFLPETFYLRCAHAICSSDLCNEIADIDMLVIYLKQLVNILRAGSMLHVEAGTVVAKPGAESPRDLYGLLLTTLWNRVPWEQIFPSDPRAARDLQRNRSVMRDILLGGRHEVAVEHVANEFFCRTGLTGENDLFRISFLDFYLLSWLRNFNIIKYLPSSGTKPVTIEITERGRKILSLLG